MIAVEVAASFLSRVLVVPKIADDLVSATSQQNAREAVADGHLRRRMYSIGFQRKEAGTRPASHRSASNG